MKVKEAKNTVRYICPVFASTDIEHHVEAFASFADNIFTCTHVFVIVFSDSNLSEDFKKEVVAKTNLCVSNRLKGKGCEWDVESMSKQRG